MTSRINRIMLKGGEVTTIIAAGSATLETTDYTICKTAITGGGDTLTLPVAGLKVGAVYKIYDTGGTAGTDAITLDPTGATTINGAATIDIDSDYGIATVMWDGTQWLAEVPSSGGGGGATDLSIGTTTSTTLDVNSSTGTNATLPQAIATTAAGLLSGADKAKLDGVESGADVTDATNVNAAGAVMESDFSPSHGLLVQQSGTGSPTMVSLGTNEILGRTTGGGSNIEGLTASDVRSLINVEDGADVTDTANVVSALSGATVTGAITFSSSVAFALDTLTPAASVNVNWTTGNMQTLTVNQATTITFTNPSGPANLVLKLIQDATGSRVFTLPTLGWGDGITPRWSTGANDVDMLFLFFDGTNYHASAMINSEQV